MGIIGCANDGHGREWQFARFLDRTVHAGAKRDGEGHGGAIRCADSGHDRGRPVLESVAIHLPGSLEVICESCFSWCKSLASVTFDANSRLSRLEKAAFYESGLPSIYFPE
jgi:hypothetical protein